MPLLANRRVAILAADDFTTLELTEPLRKLKPFSRERGGDHMITNQELPDLAALNRELVEMISLNPPLISPETRHVLSRARIA